MVDLLEEIKAWRGGYLGWDGRGKGIRTFVTVVLVAIVSILGDHACVGVHVITHPAVRVHVVTYV